MTREDATGIPYDDSLEALSNPGAAGDFFALHQPRSEAAWCAEFARLAFAPHGAPLEAGLERAGFAPAAAPFERNGTEGYLARGPYFAVLAFRGSDDLRAWGANFDALLAPWRGGGQVHRGFADALDLVWPEVEAALSSVEGPLLITGHSQGAALAILAASLRPDAGLYSFGAPRIGDPAFRAAMKERPGLMKRYVNDRDLVCRLPPASFGYRHVGEPWVIDAVGNIQQRKPANGGIGGLLLSALPLDWQSLSARFGSVLPKELSDHAPINYVSALR